MGEIAAAIESAPRKDPRPGCSVVRKLRDIEASGKADEEDMAALWKALEDPTFSKNVIARVMGSLGYSIGHDAVERHRGHGDCEKSLASGRGGRHD